MEAHQVYTPKAVMLITKIKRKLAVKGAHEHLYSWDYAELCALCEGYEDEELQACLSLLDEEVHHFTAPNVWAI